VKTYIEKFKKAEELDEFIFEILLPPEVVSEVKGARSRRRSGSCIRLCIHPSPSSMTSRAS
jgi:transcription antitermination factor NusG